MNADEQKLQKQTQFVRRRRSVLDSSKKRKKKPLQRPASLEITRLPDISNNVGSVKLFLSTLLRSLRRVVFLVLF